VINIIKKKAKKKSKADEIAECHHLFPKY